MQVEFWSFVFYFGVNFHVFQNCLSCFVYSHSSTFSFFLNSRFLFPSLLLPPSSSRFPSLIYLSFILFEYSWTWKTLRFLLAPGVFSWFIKMFFFFIFLNNLFLNLIDQWRIQNLIFRKRFSGVITRAERLDGVYYRNIYYIRVFKSFQPDIFQVRNCTRAAVYFTPVCQKQEKVGKNLYCASSSQYICQIFMSGIKPGFWFIYVNYIQTRAALQFI